MSLIRTALAVLNLYSLLVEREGKSSGRVKPSDYSVFLFSLAKSRKYVESLARSSELSRLNSKDNA